MKTIELFREDKLDRRHFMGVAAAMIAASNLGPILSIANSAKAEDISVGALHARKPASYAALERGFRGICGFEIQSYPKRRTQ